MRAPHDLATFDGVDRFDTTEPLHIGFGDQYLARSVGELALVSDSPRGIWVLRGAASASSAVMTRLNARASLALAALAGAMGLLLFGMAGTMRYWEAWAYLSIFVGGRS